MSRQCFPAPERPTVAEWLAGLIQHPDDRPRRTPMQATFGGERENRRG